MKRFMLAVGAAVIGSVIVASGGALADDYNGKYKDKGYGKYKDKQVLATGFSHCAAGKLAVFPATNVSGRKARVKVSCVNAAGDQFEPLGGGEEGPVKAKLDPGKAVTLAKECAAPSPDPNAVNGELVRCTIAGRESSLQRMRGVLHICEVEAGTGIVGCDMTEALGAGDDD